MASDIRSSRRGKIKKEKKSNTSGECMIKKLQKLAELEDMVKKVTQEKTKEESRANDEDVVIGQKGRRRRSV